MSNLTYTEFIQSIIDSRGQWGIDDDEYYEGHHIIPKCMGGTGDSRKKDKNIIRLYPEEHYLAHKLLYLENPNNYGLYAAFFGATKNYTLNAEDYAKLKLINRQLPDEILNKISAVKEFKYKTRKEEIHKYSKTLKNPEAYREQKRQQMSGSKNNMYKKGYKIANGKNGHASIRYFYKNLVFESRKELLEYFKSKNIKITTSAIRAMIHNNATMRAYTMYKDVFDNLSWEYKRE